MSNTNNEPYESVFQGNGPPGKDFGIMTRSIPVSRSKHPQNETNKRGTQLNFYSQPLTKPMTSVGPSGMNRISTREQHTRADDSGNTSILSYNTQPVKGFTQAQSAL